MGWFDGISAWFNYLSQRIDASIALCVLCEWSSGGLARGVDLEITAEVARVDPAPGIAVRCVM